MWERQIKNKFGGTQEIYRSERDASDSLGPKSDRSCNLARVEVKYIVESLNKRNEEAFENAQLIGSRVNPWELNDQFITDSFGDAIHELIIRTFDPDTVREPQLTMYIDRNGRESEVTAQVPRTTRNTVKLIVNDEMRKRNNELKKALETYQKENDLMREFIEYYHAKDMYSKFAEERRSKNESN